MASIINDVGIIVILTAFQLAAIYFTWRIGKSLVSAKFWILINLAFVIELSRRIISLLVLFEIISFNEVVGLIDSVYIPLVFWVLIAWGMFELHLKVRSASEINSKRKRR